MAPLLPALLLSLPALSLAAGPSALLTRAAAPTAKLVHGTYEGFSKSGVDWFRGIPYAQQPGPGALRFKPSLPPKNVTGTQKATEYKDVCAQADGGSEDCLYLNAARPSGISYDTKLPVVVWIHGGGFYTGGAYWDGDPTSMVQQSKKLGKPIVFVSIQYRLNSFGFLYHPEVTTAEMANLGLTDQLRALKFLHHNLAALGGDPSKVTIWGQSAGATSVEALTLFAPSGLFRASISNSGYLNSANPSKFSGLDYPGSRETTSFWALASAAGCGSEGSTAPKTAWSCLEGKDFSSLQSATLSAGSAHWAPVIDVRAGSLVNDLPANVLKNASHNKGPMILGVNKDDGSYFTSGSSEGAFLSSVGASGTGASKLAGMYGSGLTSATGDNALWDVATDWNFMGDRRMMSDALSKTQATFTYLFSETGPDDPGSGAHHSAELLFLFGKDDDKGLSAQMQSYWINFASDLDPNGQSLPKWPNATTVQDMQFLGGKTGPISDTFRRKETDLIATLQQAKPSSGSASRHRSRSQSSRPHGRVERRAPVERMRALAASLTARL